jgi:hypothetical protein
MAGLFGFGLWGEARRVLRREAAELILRCAQNDKGRGKALVGTEGSGGLAR